MQIENPAAVCSSTTLVLQARCYSPSSPPFLPWLVPCHHNRAGRVYIHAWDRVYRLLWSFLELLGGFPCPGRQARCHWDTSWRSRLGRATCQSAPGRCMQATPDTLARATTWPASCGSAWALCRYVPVMDRRLVRGCTGIGACEPSTDQAYCWAGTPPVRWLATVMKERLVVRPCALWPFSAERLTREAVLQVDMPPQRMLYYVPAQRNWVKNEVEELIEVCSSCLRRAHGQATHPCARAALGTALYGHDVLLHAATCE